MDLVDDEWLSGAVPALNHGSDTPTHLASPLASRRHPLWLHSVQNTEYVYGTTLPNYLLTTPSNIHLAQ